MKATIERWGDSAAVRIPAALTRAVNFHLDEVVELRAEVGRIVIESVQRKVPNLDRLLEGITAENLHRPADFSPLQGKEVV